MAGVAYIFYRVWIPLWSVLIAVVKISALMMVSALIVGYFWPAALLDTTAFSAVHATHALTMLKPLFGQALARFSDLVGVAVDEEL